MSGPLTATMVAAVDFATENDGLVRMQGGFWTKRGAGWNGGAPDAEHFGTSTIQGCVSRGALEYTEWRDGRTGRFPIAAAVPAGDPQ